jgi:hypothetical protein
MDAEPTTSIKTAKNGLYYVMGSDGKKSVVSPEMVKVLKALTREPARQSDYQTGT